MFCIILQICNFMHFISCLLNETYVKSVLSENARFEGVLLEKEHSFSNPPYMHACTYLFPSFISYVTDTPVHSAL